MVGRISDLLRNVTTYGRSLASPLASLPLSPSPNAGATNRGIKLGVALLHLRMTLVVKPFRRGIILSRRAER